MDIMEELEAAAQKLREQDEHRAGQVAYRDDLIRRALAAGHTWVEIQGKANLTPRGLALAIKRGRKP